MNTLRCREIWSQPALKLIVVESTDLGKDSTSHFCFLQLIIKPVALIVCQPTNIFAIDMDSNPVDLDQLRQALPELNTQLP